MSKFAYEARDEDGLPVAGMIAAESLEHAGMLLSERNLFVVRIGGESKRKRHVAVRGHASRAQVAWCMSQLAIMVETGIRLVDALECLARQASQPRLRALLEQLSKSVQEGRSLSEAMAMYPKSFAPSLTAMIRASEMSGTMGRVLQRSSAYLMNDLQTLRRVRAAIVYPTLMLVASLAVAVFLLTVILPRFADIFANRGVTLPLPTRILMAVSESLIGDWHYWVAAGVGVVVASVAWSRTAIARRQRDFLIVSLPLISGVFRTLYQCRSFHTMAVLLDSGVALTDAMKIMLDIVPNTYYRDLWLAVDAEIQRGQRLAGPLLQSDLIPEPVAQMIDSGDQSGKLGVVFARLAEFMDEEYNRAVRTATQFIEPAMILIMGVFIGLIAASLMLPLFQASRVVAS